MLHKVTFDINFNNVNDLYKQIGTLLNQSGFNEGMSFVTETITGKVLYITIYCPTILLYSKEESIKKILNSYDVNISSNPNIQCITIKIK